jgi:hypothetical protein
MEKWEYLAFWASNIKTGTNMVDALREHGENGWELVSVSPDIVTEVSEHSDRLGTSGGWSNTVSRVGDVHTTNNYFVVMKRRKQ